MLDLSARNRGKANKHPIPNGIYDSVVLEVKWAEGYAAEEAYEVSYKLISEDGKIYKHREIFKTDERNKRTAAFEDYIADNGVEDLSSFVGVTEKLTIQRVKVGDREFANIVSREFVNA